MKLKMTSALEINAARAHMNICRVTYNLIAAVPTRHNAAKITTKRNQLIFATNHLHKLLSAHNLTRTQALTVLDYA